MKKIFSLALVLFAALLFTNTSASAQNYHDPRFQVGVAINGYYAPQVAIAPNYNSYACEYDEYNQPFNCQPDYPNQSYYVNGCGYYYACGGYYGGYYGRDYRFDRWGGRDNGGYRGGSPRGGYPVQPRGGYPVQPRGFGGQGGGGFQGGGTHGGGGSRLGGHR